MSWELLLLAEISIVKALLINRFSLVMGIDENFAGRFLLRFNLGYLLISQTGRFVHIFFCFVFNLGGIYLEDCRNISTISIFLLAVAPYNFDTKMV